MWHSIGALICTVLTSVSILYDKDDFLGCSSTPADQRRVNKLPPNESQMPT